MPFPCGQGRLVGHEAAPGAVLHHATGWTGCSVTVASMTPPLQLLRNALTQLSLEADQQRRLLDGAVVTDELALDLDNAVASLAARAEAEQLHIDSSLLAEVAALNRRLDVPPTDPLWDDDSLDTHPTWAAIRVAARALLTRLPG